MRKDAHQQGRDPENPRGNSDCGITGVLPWGTWGWALARDVVGAWSALVDPDVMQAGVKAYAWDKAEAGDIAEAGDKADGRAKLLTQSYRQRVKDRCHVTNVGW